MTHLIVTDHFKQRLSERFGVQGEEEIRKYIRANLDDAAFIKMGDGFYIVGKKCVFAGERVNGEFILKTVKFCIPTNAARHPKTLKKNFVIIDNWEKKVE